MAKFCQIWSHCFYDKRHWRKNTFWSTGRRLSDVFRIENCRRVCFLKCAILGLFLFTFRFFNRGGGTSRLPPPHFLSPLFPTPVRILGSNRAITGATLEVIPWHNNYFCYNILPPMSAFEPRISGIGSDSSANWATTKKSRQKNHWIVETSSGLSKSGLRFSFTLWGSWFMSFEPSASLYMRILWAISEGIITHTHSTSTCSVS